MQYQTNSAAFELPPQLKDKTMHMFVLNENGPSEFSLVISHADVPADETLADFGDRLLKEMGRALPRFQLRGMKDSQVGGSPAIELAYSWRKDGNFMHQRQAVVLVQGAEPGSRQAMLVAATCLSPFNEEWNAAFDNILASMTLRHPLDAAAAAAKRKAPVATQPYTFALSARRRSLHVFANQGDACRRTDAREVELDTWAFFDAAGNRLQPYFTAPNSYDPGLRNTGMYQLAADPDPDAGSLLDNLHLAAIYDPPLDVPGLPHLAAVRSFLEQQAG
ncbi:DcrB-related protein [Pseudoduganella sp. DS3]|uniref:DcrB-related protein n=1 Tax=Pseudoduganella guangdongensis TaxID=2692179 RepID=A0A6N9HQR9_9BURK|nr:DcrB-related protein [Pseudoduganella guangdongensis]MYN05085.1 DcrB-related protein [Pseudoduganella guangdongensis]